MKRITTGNYRIETRLNDKELIFGREKEINQIIRHFDKVIEGEFAVCTICGGAGVGKTYLISNIANRLLNVHATYLYGKYKHYNNSLFSALNEVFKGIIEHTLTFSDEKLSAVKTLLIKKLGDDCSLIISICPEAEKLLGYFRKIDEQDYRKLEHRFHNASYIFFDVLSQELYPLIIHIDDLQWADKGSRRLIDFLCEKSTTMNFFLILSYRDEINDRVKKDEITNALSNMRNQLTVHLKRLNEMETKEMLLCVFQEIIKEVDKVSKHIYKATLGNPFYIRQLIETIFDEKQTHFDSINKRWVFNTDFLKSVQLPEDIMAILIHHIEKLSAYDKELLKLMACIGGQADRKMLQKVVDSEDENAISRLENLCEKGLIIRDRNEKDEEKTKYYISHDIIFEIIYESMDEDESADFHYRIANSLIEDSDKVYAEEYRIFIASQLLGCKGIIFEKEDSSNYVLELYYAALKAKQMTLIEDAVNYLKLCLQLMPASNASVSSATLWKVELELAECLYLCGRTKKSEIVFAELVKERKNQQELVLIKSRLLLLLTYSGKYEKGISLGFEILNHLDYKVKTDHIDFRTFIEISKCRLFLTHRKVNTIEYMPRVNDAKILSIQSTLIRMSAMANLIDEKLFALLILKLSSISAKHGVSKFSAPAYAAYSFIVYHFLGEKGIAFKLSRSSKAIVSNDGDTRCMTYFIMSAFVDHWYMSSEECAQSLINTIETGVRAGEFQYSGYAFSTLIEMRYVMGMSVENLNQIIKSLDQYDARLNHYVTQSTLLVLQNHLDLLTYNNAAELNEKQISSLEDSQKLTYYYYKLQRLYLEGRIEDCYGILCEIEPISGLFIGFITQADLLFYQTLIRLDMHFRLKAVDQLKNRMRVDRALKKFEKWIKLYKNNHYARYLLIKAKRLEIYYKDRQVGVLYEEGVEFAEEHSQLQLVAIGKILSSRYFENNKKISLMYKKEAIDALEGWGAKHFSVIFSEKYMINKDTGSDNETESEIKDEISARELINEEKEQANRLSYHIEQVETMSKDDTFLYILDNIIEENMADYGAIFMENNDQIDMVYEQKEENVNKLKKAIYMEDVIAIPHKVMRYVMRTGVAIEMAQKPTTGLFANDTYFDNKAAISLLCMPIKYMDVFVGIVYLEWNESKEALSNVVDQIKNYMPLLITKTRAELNEDKVHGDFDAVDTPLTKREEQVFKLVIKGLTNKQIGDELVISLSTVKTHIINIYSKLNIKNRVAAVEKAKELGFTD